MKPTFLVANDQSPQNACSKYPSQTNWIWQFFRETMLLLCQEVVLTPQREDVPFSRTGFHVNLFLLLEAYYCRLWIFCFIDSWKMSPNFAQRSLVRDLWPWLNKTSQNKKRRSLFSKNVLKIVPMRVCKFSFLNTSNTYRVFGNYFRPRWKPLVDARVGDSRRLLSEVFERKADYFMLTTSSEKNFSLIASRKEKNTWNIVKITFSCGNYNIFTFFSWCLPKTRTKYHIRGPRTIEKGGLFSNLKQNIYVWNLNLQDYREEQKSYLHGVFQLVTWRFG